MIITAKFISLFITPLCSTRLTLRRRPSKSDPSVFAYTIFGVSLQALPDPLELALTRPGGQPPHSYFTVFYILQT